MSNRGHPRGPKDGRHQPASVGPSQILRKFKGMGLCTRGMTLVNINEELELAKAAKAAINALLTATSKSAVLATLKDAYRAAVLNLSGEGLLNEARGIVGI